MKYIKQIIASLLLLSIPVISFGLVATWQATSPTAGIVSPTNINGVAQSIGVSSTATSTFAGPVSIAGYVLATSTTVCIYPQHCQYQVPATASSSQIQINAAMTAMNAIGGGEVLVEPGLYVISDLVQIPSLVTLMGSGIGVTIIKARDNYTPATNIVTDGGTSINRQVLLVNKGNLPIASSTVQGITWDANGQNKVGETDDGNNKAIDILNATNFRFIGNEVKNSINWSVYFGVGNQFWIQNNYVEGGWSTTYTQQDGIHERHGQNFWIQNNYVNTNGGGTSGDDGIVAGADEFGGQSRDTTGGDITNNVIYSFSRGILIFNAGPNQTQHMNVSHNTIMYAYRSGIELQKIGNDNLGGFQDITVDTNKIYNYGNLNTESTAGIFLVQNTPFVVFNGLHIEGNTVMGSRNANSQGIAIQGKGNNVQIVNNSISDQNGDYGIRLGTDAAPVKDYIISDNTIISTTTAQTDYKSIWIYGTEAGTVHDNVILGNSGASSYAVLVQAAATAGNDANGIAKLEVSQFNNVHDNIIYNTVNGIVEGNNGANPNNNQYSDNVFNGVTTKYVLLGLSSQIVGFAGSNYGIGTSTPGSIFSIGGVANFTTATSTFYGNGLNLTSGCFAIAGTCITGGGGGSGTVSSGLAGQLGYYNASGNTIVGTSTNPLYVTALYATTTTATSTFIGAVSVGAVQTTSRDNLVSIIGQRTYTTSGTSQADAGMVNINNNANVREALEVFQPSTDTVSAPSLVRYENQNTSATNIMQINKTAATGAAANLLFDAIGQNCPAFESKELTWGTNSYWQWCAHQGEFLIDNRNNADTAHVPAISATSPFSSTTPQRFTLFPGDYATANGNWTDGTGTFNVFGTSTNSTMMNLTSLRGATEGNLFKVLQNGNVGIGTTSPADKLMVSINSIGSGITVDGTSAGQFAPQSALSVDDNQRFAFGVALGAGFFSNISASGDSVVRALGGTGRLIISNQQSGSILFGSGSSNGNDTTKMTMTSLGNFGIGTTTPYATLSVQSGASTGDAFVIATSSGAAVFGVDNDGHQFTSGPAPALFCNGAGNPTIVGDDQGGTITTNTAATLCTLTFSKAYRNTPYVIGVSTASIPANVTSLSASAATITFATLTGGTVYYSFGYHK